MRTYLFELDITRPGYLWEVADDGSILWIPDAEDAFLVTGEAGAQGKTVRVCLNNATDADKVCSIMAAAYDSEQKMLAAGVKEACAVDAGTYTWANLTLDTEETISEIRPFVLEAETMRPLEEGKNVPLR